MGSQVENCGHSIGPPRGVPAWFWGHPNPCVLQRCAANPLLTFIPIIKSHSYPTLPRILGQEVCSDSHNREKQNPELWNKDLQEELGQNQPPPSPELQGARIREKVLKPMPNTSEELWGQIPAAPALQQREQAEGIRIALLLTSTPQQPILPPARSRALLIQQRQEEKRVISYKREGPGCSPTLFTAGAAPGSRSVEGLPSASAAPAHMCRFMCRARWSDLENARSQRWHWKGRCPVCLR